MLTRESTCHRLIISGGIFHRRRRKIMAYVTLRRSPWIKTAQFFAYIAPLLMFSAEGRAVSIEDVSKALELVSKTVDLADKTFTSGSTTDANVSTTFDA